MPPAHQGRRGSRSRAAEGRVDLAVESSARNRRRDTGPRWPWPVVCILGCLLDVLAVWAVLTGLVVPEWLALPKGSFGDLARGATQLWLLAHGVPLSALGLRIGLAPLALTLLILVVGEETARYSARVMSAARRSSRRPVAARHAYRVAALHATVHLVAVVVAATAAGSGAWGRVVAGGLAAGVLPGLVGALRGARLNPADLLPGRVRDVGAGALCGCAVAVAGGSAAMAVSLVAHGSRLVELHQSLGAGAWGGAVLILLQLAWLPNLMLWWTSWTLGPGFAVGAGSSVSPLGVHLGIVPSIPVLGALPAAGEPQLAVRLWLLVPVAAGVAAALVTSRRRRGTGPAETIGLATASGVGAGLLLSLLGMLSNGGIGTGRLAVMGTQMPAMLGMAVALLGGGGLVAGGAVAALRWRAARPGRSGSDDDVDEADGDGPGEAGEVDEVDREAAEITRKVPRGGNPAGRTTARGNPARGRTRGIPDGGAGSHAVSRGRPRSGGTGGPSRSR